MAIGCQIFRKILFLLKNSWKIVFSNCLNFTFSIIFLVNNGHSATKVHVNKVQYCGAGHILTKLKPSISFLYIGLKEGSEEAIAT